VRRFGLGAVARIRAAEARRSSLAARRAVQETAEAGERAAALQARVRSAGTRARAEAVGAGGPVGSGGARLRWSAAGLAAESWSRERLDRARRRLIAQAEEARGVAEILAGVAEQAREEALRARRRSDALGRAEARWNEARLREREGREEREADEAWGVRP
jgi:hypothetical protein